MGLLGGLNEIMMIKALGTVLGADLVCLEGSLLSAEPAGAGVGSSPCPGLTDICREATWCV